MVLGDFVDRGPNTPDVLRLAMSMVRAGQAYAVPGNHDVKLVRALKGKNVKIAHGLAESLAQLAEHPTEFRDQAAAFLDRTSGDERARCLCNLANASHP